MTLEVVAAGPRSLVQDSGRPGRGAMGVSLSGAFDRRATAQANTLVGNDADAAVIEVLGGGLSLRAQHPHVIAVTGAVGPLNVDGEPVGHGRVVRLATDRVLRVEPVAAGLRTYVAVAGGLEVEPVLGSRSTDTLSGLGPAPLADGDELPVGQPPRLPDLDDVPALLTTGEIGVDVVLGPRDDWFTADAVRTLLGTPWRVSGDSDRVGVRLDGPSLQRARTDELPSEPCVRGSIQVAADGQPIVFGPDHPVTGGYPVIAVVVDAHTDRLAQARPGDVVRFTRTSRSR